MTSPIHLERQASQHVARLQAEAQAIRSARESRTRLASRIAGTLRTWAERLDGAHPTNADRHAHRQPSQSANAARLTH
ncbi:MAG: hypothetical protein R6W77_02490 [Trueperaceae bacterium]